MKGAILLTVLTILVSGCASAPIQNNTSPTELSTSLPSAAFTSTPTSTLPPTFTPTATLEPGLFAFDIAPDAPAEDVGYIKLGIGLARAHLRDFLGGDIAPEKQNFTVKIVADGRGKEGSCCTALAESGPRPFFDVKHPNWNIGSSDYWSNTDHHMNAGAHEYTHAWQSSLGCLSIHNQPLGNWINEGMAQYISINSLKRSGYVSEADYQDLINVALGNTASKNLAVGEQNSPPWLDDIAFLAINKLVSLAPTGELSLRAICENISSGKSVDESFSEAFGISRSDFYKVFAEYQKKYFMWTPTAVPAGMIAVHGKAVLLNSNQNPRDYIVSFCNLKIEQCLPGNIISVDRSFNTYLDPGDYRASVNPLNGGNGFGWYTANGLVPDPSCAEIIHVSDQDINITVDFHPTDCPTPTPAPTPKGGVRVYGNIILRDTKHEYADISLLFCKGHNDPCVGANTQVNPDGSFSIALEPAIYKISVGDVKTGEFLGWYAKGGLVPYANCGEKYFSAKTGQDVELTIDLQIVPCR